MKHRAGQRGFTLIEVLVAFAILALSIGALMVAFGNSAKLSARVEETSLALLHAQSLLDGLEVSLGDDPVEQTGAFGDGYRWRVQVAPYGSDEDREAWLAAAYDVKVEVWPARATEPAAQLQTLRLVPRGLQ